jgi:cell division protein FtsW (lipid II flippase)
VQNEVSQGAVNSAGSGGSLPFTGMDLALLVAGGVSLLVVGAGLRRAAKRHS